MINKICSLSDAFNNVRDGNVVLVGGFGAAGQPVQLIDALIEHGAGDLTVVTNNAGVGHEGLARLLELGRVRKIVCSFPRSSDPVVFETLYSAGRIELEIVPQGTIAERIRAAGAGVEAFYTPTGAGTLMAKGKQSQVFNGRECILETAIFADVALIEAWQADRWGNLTYRRAGRNFNPIMAMAAKLTIAQTQHVVELGSIDPETVVTPGVFVDRVVHIPYGNPPEF